MSESMENGFNSDNNQKDSWKTKFSSVLNEDDILYSLFVLSLFYIVYAIVTAVFNAKDNNVSDEERFIQNCYCSFSQRFFYRFWFAMCSVIWII